MGTMPVMSNMGMHPAAPGGMHPTVPTVPATGGSANHPVAPGGVFNPMAAHGTAPAGVFNPMGQGTGTMAPGGSAPVGTSGATTAFNPVSISSGLNTTDGSNTLTGDFKDTYGAGTGKALAGVLGNLGTATDGAVQATNNAAELDASKQQANIASQLAAAGISPDSSTNALEQGDFASSFNANLQSTDANMQLQQQDTLISALQNEGQAHGPDSSTWDSVLSGITDAAQIAGVALMA